MGGTVRTLGAAGLVLVLGAGCGLLDSASDVPDFEVDLGDGGFSDFVIGADGIGVATLDMPGRPFNVFSDDMIDELDALTTTIEQARGLKGVVVTSGKDAFMAGADLAMVRGFTTLRFEHDAATIRRSFSRLSYLLRRFEKLTVPTVAAVNGLALGGGLEFAMACHHRVAAHGEVPVHER